MGIYIGVEYFQIIHYYYFCMGIFSFTAAVIFGFPYAILFVVFCILHSAISWYVSWFVQKVMKKFVVIQSTEFMVSHVVLTIFIAGSTLLLWYFQILIERFLIDAIIQVNFFVFFLGLLWYLMTRFSLIGGIFDYFDALTLKRAKRLIIKGRNRLGLKKLITDIRIKSYEIGSEPELDSLLLSLWRERKKNFEENVYEFEMRMAEKLIDKFRRRIEKIKSKHVMSATDQKIMRTYERFIREYEKNSVEYERFFRETRKI